MDTTLYLTREDVRSYEVDGERVEVREWDIVTDLPDDHVFAVFDYVSVGDPDEGRLLFAPKFEYDLERRCVVGETEPTTLAERMVEVIRSARRRGCQEYDAKALRTVAGAEQYVHIRFVCPNRIAHVMACIPFFDRTSLRILVPAQIRPRAEEDGDGPRPSGMTRLRVVK